MTQKLSLYGFNNLTKNLSLSLYKVSYIPSDVAIGEYNTYINNLYNSDLLTNWLTHIAQAIGGNVLNIASQDYSPQGASVTLMISEEAEPESLVAHLDKSHICIHTYPEDSPQNGIAIFRADIELSTCGVISPLNILNYIIEEFSADVMDIDFRIRGMTRNNKGEKCFNDMNINNLSEYLTLQTKKTYQIYEGNSLINNTWHASLMRNDIKWENQVVTGTENTASDTYNKASNVPSDRDCPEVIDKVRKELYQLFKK